MPPYLWIAFWIVVVAGLALLVVREKRSGRRGPDEFDTLQHGAVREASGQRDIRGPNTTGLWGP